MRCRRCHEKPEGVGFLCERCAEEARADVRPVPPDVGVAVGVLLAEGVDPIALGFQKLAERVAPLAGERAARRGSAWGARLVEDEGMAPAEAAALCRVSVNAVYIACSRLRRLRELGG